jgi:cytochrome c biogenesis protein CcdA
MMESLERLLSDSPVLALFIVFWIGAVASLSSCIVIRLPIVLGYVAAVGDSKKRSLLLTALFLAGLVLYILSAQRHILGGTVHPAARQQAHLWAGVADRGRHFDLRLTRQPVAPTVAASVP